MDYNDYGYRRHMSITPDAHMGMTIWVAVGPASGSQYEAGAVVAANKRWGDSWERLTWDVYDDHRTIDQGTAERVPSECH